VGLGTASVISSTAGEKVSLEVSRAAAMAAAEDASAAIAAWQEFRIG
jgi:hypothetical protein